MKRLISRLLALVLVCVIGLMGCSDNSSTLTGNYSEDTLNLIDSLRTAIELPEKTEAKSEAQAIARQIINDYASRYRRDPAVSTLPSFTTMRTALNSLAGHYSSYPNRPIPEKLKKRLEQEFKQAELALKRGV
ncbi:photosystem II protein Psb27 [Okeania sp.]|uniref:photosystem II protein Psb27 n=1 Tax=Okeania sp. TaxID=3100323 RepID=UPI002B4B4007|nr:photosystem II protein Psb27 [Okeania sp.]MEB3342747.1 photosystem II protein Psb27 [Okeania sp.]